VTALAVILGVPVLVCGAFYLAVESYEAWSYVRWLDAMLEDAERRREAEDARHVEQGLYR